MTNMPTAPQAARPTWVGKSTASTVPMNNSLAVIFTALTIVIMAYSPLVGPAAIVALYLMWLPCAFNYSGRRLRRSLQGNLLPGIYVVYCLGSVVWSDYRSVTARATLEAASMMICALVIPQVVNLRAFIVGLNVGVMAVMAATLVAGNYGIDHFSGTYSLVGLFGSKNQVGLYAEIGILGALIYLFSKNSIWKKALFAVAPLGLSMVCLYMSKSAASVASLAIVLAICVGASIIVRVPKNMRKLTVGATVFAVFIVAVAGVSLNWQQSGFSLLGKDSTLTGRTYLWSEGMKVGMENPVFGRGFAAFWVPGQPQAEKYWFAFDIFGRSGFHFHNTFVQIFVDLGIVGVIFLALLFFRNIVVTLRHIRGCGFDMPAFFALGLTSMFLIRAFVEVDILGSFGIGELLFFTVIPYLNLPSIKQGEFSASRAARPAAKLI